MDCPSAGLSLGPSCLAIHRIFVLDLANIVMISLKLFFISVLASSPACALGSDFAEPGQLEILHLTYQSGGLTFHDWVALFTLCFAPLIAHILSGIPKIIILSHDRPTWRHLLGLYNPTTILWRYLAITDRRLRAKSWNSADMSASNAYFWTPRGWDGSEALVRKSREYCVSVPDYAHASLVSASTIKTLIISLQGADAMYSLIIASYDNTTPTNFIDTISLGTVFVPLAFLGLVRLVAGYWLTEDFVYINSEYLHTIPASEGSKAVDPAEKIQLIYVRTPTTRELLSITDTWTGESYHSPNTWQSWSFRTLFMIPLLGLLFLCIWSFIPRGGVSIGMSITALTLLVFYLFFVIVTLVVLGFYFIRGSNTTTVLPCITSLWYQIYTGALMGFILALIVIASIETKKSPCGHYTTWPTDFDRCTYITSATNETDGAFGVAVRGNIVSQSEEAMAILYLDGWCQGTFNGSQQIQFVNGTASLFFLL